MNEPDYKRQLDGIFQRVTEIVRERSNLDAEAEKLTQLMYATANMLPDKERNEVFEKWMNTFQGQLNKETGITDAIRKIFREGDFHERLTVTHVRNRLVSSGYDFSGYLSNPLASVSSTLARLKEKGELESSVVEGVTVYKRKIRRFPRLRGTGTKSFGAPNSMANMMARSNFFDAPPVVPSGGSLGTTKDKK